MSFKRLFLSPGLRFFVVTPDFDEVVTACTCETFDGGVLRGSLTWSGGLLVCDKRSRDKCRCPRNGIATDSMTGEDVSVPLTVV
jgi:hypothetical protein